MLSAKWPNMLFKHPRITKSQHNYSLLCSQAPSIGLKPLEKNGAEGRTWLKIIDVLSQIQKFAYPW